ncbi:MAG: NAD-binding protein [Anaerolineae bacterium]|jgi:Trk K+ transport system NAD-binding subunit|nr:NAD-binding protein [Anaerolineae bacterium]
MPTQAKLVLPSGRQSYKRWFRFWRAVYRDTSALLNEFKVPLFVFLVASLGGGFVYNELLAIAGKDRLPYYEMPYVMVALMILESPIDLPSEPYLTVFWYVMPLVALYVIGRGAADFFRLFFNRNERRDAWEEAVAWTYRNHIIVMGAGHVGMGVIEQLTQMGFEVVLIDHALTPELDAQLSEMRVPAIIGDGRSPNVLEKAGLQYAQGFIACTSDDYVNLEVTMTIREINPKIRVVARVWDERLARHIREFLYADAFSSASLAAPVFAGYAVGIELTQTLFVNGKAYSTIKLTVEPGSFMDGCTIEQMQDNYHVDVVLHERNGHIDPHPDGAIPLKHGDTLVFFASQNRIFDVVAQSRPPNRQRNHIIVLGAGHVGTGVVTYLSKLGFPAVMIEQDVTPELRAELANLEVTLIEGDGRQPLILEAADIESAQAFIACTSNDNINLEVIMAVREVNKDLRVIARMWDDRFVRHARTFLKSYVLSSSVLTSPVFAGYGAGFEASHTLLIKDKEYSVIKLIIQPGSFMDGCTVDEMQNKYTLDIVLHMEAKSAKVHPDGATRLKAGDTIVLFALHHRIIDIVDRNRL